MGRTCELCGERATLYCSADDANLCWSCDAKVHGANFLVVRHIRSLLCSTCCEETECQTAGAHPSSLLRHCSHCDPAHVEEAFEAEESAVLERKDDSEEMSAPAASVCGSGGSCDSRESHTEGRRGVRDDETCRRSGMVSRKDKVMGCRFIPTKRTRVPDQSSKMLDRNSKKRRSSSPVSVMSVDTISYEGASEHELGYCEKEPVRLLSLMPSS